MQPMKRILIALVLMVAPSTVAAQVSNCPVSLAALGNGWSIPRCVLATGTGTTITATISIGNGDTFLVGGYECGGPSCSRTPPVAFTVKSNLNNPETCLTSHPSPSSPNLSSSGQPTRWYWWVGTGCANGITSISLNNPTGFFSALWVLDLPHAATSNPIDIDGNSASASGVASMSVSTSSSTTNANDLICALTDNDHEKAQTIASGWTAALNDGTGGTGNGILACKSVTSKGTYTFTATWTGADTYEAHIIAIRAVSVAVTNPPRSFISSLGMGMGIGLGKIAKLARGNVGMDDLANVLSALGPEVSMQPVVPPEGTRNRHSQSQREWQCAPARTSE